MSEQYKYVHDEVSKKVYRFPKVPQVTERPAGPGRKVIGHDVRMTVDVVRADNELTGHRWKFPTSEHPSQFFELKHSKEDALYYFSRHNEPRGTEISEAEFVVLSKLYGG